MIQKLCLLPILSSVLITICASSYSQTILPTIFDNYPPYNFIDENNQRKGSTFELLNEAIELMGYQPSPRQVAWKRAYKMAVDGNVAIVYTLVSKPERVKHLLFSNVVATFRSVFFKLQIAKIEWQHYTDLKPYRIGFTDGYGYPHVFLQAIANGVIQGRKITADDNPEFQHLKNLVNKRVDLIICNLDTCNYIKKRYYPQFDSIDYIDSTVGDVGYFYVAVSRKWPMAKELLKQLNTAITHLHQNGRMRAIYQKYGVAVPSKDELELNVVR